MTRISGCHFKPPATVGWKWEAITLLFSVALCTLKMQELSGSIAKSAARLCNLCFNLPPQVFIPVRKQLEMSICAVRSWPPCFTFQARVTNGIQMQNWADFHRFYYIFTACSLHCSCFFQACPSSNSCSSLFFSPGAPQQDFVTYISVINYFPYFSFQTSSFSN